MGNAIMRGSGDSEGEKSGTGTSSTCSSRKHSTVSAARFLLYGERTEFLNDEQKNHIRICWKRIENDVASVGVITFIQLFETHPDVKQVFMPFNGIKNEELRQSKQLRAHALRVMAFVEKAVARLDEKDKLDKILDELGKAHFYYGAPKKYIDLIGPQFIKAIEPSLQDIWSKEIQDSWTQLFRYVSQQMKEGLAAAEKAKRGSK